MIELLTLANLITFGKVYLIYALFYLVIKSLVNGVLQVNNSTDDWVEAASWPFATANLIGQLISLIWRDKE
jgi:intracellular septation protein A